MAISPINISRVSQNLRTNFIIDSVRRSQADLFNVQTQIATGRSFVSPSDDPVRATRVLDLTQTVSREQQFIANLQHGDNMLAAADDAMTDVNSLLIDASTIASANVSNLTSASERDAVAELIGGIRRQLQTVGNRQFNGRYLFAGRDTTQRPFVDALGGIAYTGDTGALITQISDGLTADVNIPGNVLFGALSSRIAADVDLSPVLREDARLDDLNGATGHGIRPGTLVFNEAGGSGTFTVDLTTADTIGNIVTQINQAAEAAGSSLTASVSENGIVITPGSTAVSVRDVSGGVIAADLGLLTVAATTAPIIGNDLGARLTPLTPVADLAGGAGIDLASGLTITNGGQTVTLDLSAAETVQDITNALNAADVFVLARINEAGTGIDVFNQVSGSSMTIGENGGTTAADLGIRTFDTNTPLARLNFGLGVTIVEGENDVRVTASDGSTVDVNLDGAVTVGDVIDRINTAATDAGVGVTASFAEVGNGIRISDATGGSGDFSVTGLNGSAAAMDLGLAQTVSGGTELIGEDRNPTRTEGILSALVELENALRGNDTQGITLAAERINAFTTDVTRIHGVVGARSKDMQTQLRQTQDSVDSTGIFLSKLQDLDFTEAITKMQAMTTQLQATLQTSSRVMNLSLLDFLR